MAATDFEVTVNTKDFDQSIRRIIAEMKEVDKTSKDTGNSIDGMGKKIAGAAAAYFSVQQAQQFVNKVIEIRGQMQKLDIAFTTMLNGNREASSKLMSELTEFASVTPFGLMDAASGAKQLLAYGFAAENVVKDMEMLGNVAAGVSAPLNDIVYLYGTLQASGRVATMDIRQFAGRGIPIYRELAAVMGVAEGEINNLVSAGRVGFKDIEKAFQRMTSQGGTFYNLMREQSKSLPGQISNLEDSIDMMFNEIGAASQDFISKGIEGVAWLVENYEKAGRTLLELVGAYGAYKVALVSVKVLTSGMTAAEVAHYVAIVATEKAQKALNATMLKNPYVLAAATIAALAYGMYRLVTHQTEAEKLQEGLNKSFAQSQAEAAKEIAELDRLKGKLKGCKEGTEEYKKTKEEIVNQFGKYDDTLKAETLSVQTLIDKYDDLINKVKESTNQRMYNSWLATNQQDYNESEAEYLDEIYKKFKKRYGVEKSSQMYQELLQAVYKGYNPADKKQGYTEIWRALQATGTLGEANDFAMLYKENQKLINEAKKRFGIDQKTEDEKQDDATVTAEKTNKAYWEKKKKDAEAELEALATYELNTQKAKEIRERIAKANANIAKYDTSEKPYNQTKAANIDNNYDAEVAKQLRDGQLELRQASIDGMKEGFEKERLQLELEYDRNKNQILTERDEMIEAMRDNEQKQWELENPKAKEKGLAFDRSRITVKDLSDEQIDLIYGKMMQNEENRAKALDDLNKTQLDKYRTYFEQRKAIEDKYEQERKTVKEAGGTEANIAEVDRKKDEDLKAIDEQFAMRSEEYEAWCNYIADLSLVELQRLLAQAKLELDKASPDDEKIAQKRAAVNKLQEQVNKKTAEQNVGKRTSNRSIKEWTELEEVLTNCISKFDEIGDAIGGAAGEAIKTAGTLASSTISMVNGMMQFVQMCSNGVIVAGNATATAMKIIESASIVLTIISTAIQFATMIASLFSNEEDDAERIAKLEAAISRLEWERNNPEILKMWRERGKAIFDVNRALNLYLSLQRMSRIAYIPEKIAAQTRNWDTAVKKLADSYKKLSYSEATILTEEKYKNVGKDLGSIAEQQMLLAQKNKQLQNVDDKDEDVDWAQIEQNQQKIEELRLEAAQLMNGYVEEIIGGSAHDIATKLGDAFWEATREGEDAMNALKDEVDDILGDIVKRMLISSTLEEPIAKLFDKKKEEWFKDGIYQGANVVKASMMNFDEELMDATQPYRDAMELLPEELKEKLFNDADRQSASRGIATASQESVDENNARLTTIQAHTASIVGNVDEMIKEIREQKIISQRTTQIIDDIRANTVTMIQHLQGIETNTSKLNNIANTLSDIALKGVKMK